MATVVSEKSDGIGWIRINRPEARNAVNLEAVRALVAALREAGDDTDVKAIVISSVGDDFSAGADLKEVVRELDDLDANRITINELIETTTDGLQEIARLIRSAEKVVVASVDGYAVGGGCEIALACDLIVGAEDAQFGFPETRAGMSITGGVTKILAESIGAARARDLMLTGRFIGAREALEIGMINRVAEGDPDVTAENVVREVLRGSPLAVVAHKRLSQQSPACDFNTTLNLEKQTIGILCTTDDAREAVSAFVEKREPTFTGR